MSDPSFSFSSALRTLRRIKGNDRTLTELQLVMSETPTIIRREDPHSEMFYIKDGGPGLERICDLIGPHSHLRDVSFDSPLFYSDIVAKSSHFDGLRQNKSIRSLWLGHCELGHGVGHEVLKAFEENNERLAKLALWQCTLLHRGTDALTATLTKCTHLTTISLASCGIDDHIMSKLAEGLKGHRNLTALYLHENHIQTAGCQAVATLLRDPECSLFDLDLRSNMIDNFGAKAVADALAENKKLEIISLDDNYITADGWDSYIRILCNTSSINATYASNHMLRKIALFGRLKLPGSRMHNGDYAIPDRLFELVALNSRVRVRVRGDNPKRRMIQAARQKILDVHFCCNFDMAPIAEGSMDMRLLPRVLSWMGRPYLIRLCNAAGHTAVYELLRQTPTLCGKSCAIKSSVEGSIENQQGKTRNRDDSTGHRGERSVQLRARAPSRISAARTLRSPCQHLIVALQKRSDSSNNGSRLFRWLEIFRRPPAFVIPLLIIAIQLIRRCNEVDVKTSEAPKDHKPEAPSIRRTAPNEDLLSCRPFNSTAAEEAIVCLPRYAPLASQTIEGLGLDPNERESLVTRQGENEFTHEYKKHRIHFPEEGEGVYK